MLTDRRFPQPLMGLLFGDLTQDFDKFITATQNIDRNDPHSTTLIDEAGEALRHAAARGAAYLTFIGA